jgi:phage gpG-like protein
MMRSDVIGDDLVSIKIKRASATTQSKIAAAVNRVSIGLQARIISQKLSGQVLRVRTGTLRRSITHALLTESESVTGIVSTNVKYGKAHEYGFKGAIGVKAHLRVIKQAFGKSIYPVTISVAGHTRNVNLPERSFLRSALKDVRPSVIANLTSAATK